MNSNQQIIIGLDPGSLHFGYGVIVQKKQSKDYLALDFGQISPPKGELNQRILYIYNHLTNVFETYCPQIVCLEKIFYHKNNQSAFTLAHARAMALLLSAQYNSKLLEVSPRKVKLAVTGFGGASKENVGKMIQNILNIKEMKLSVDESDALAIAFCAAMNPDGFPKAKQKRKKSSSQWTLEAIQKKGIIIK